MKFSSAGGEDDGEYNGIGFGALCNYWNNIICQTMVLSNDRYRISEEKGCWEITLSQHPVTLISMGHGMKPRAHTH